MDGETASTSSDSSRWHRRTPPFVTGQSSRRSPPLCSSSVTVSWRRRAVSRRGSSRVRRSLRASACSTVTGNQAGAV